MPAGEAELPLVLSDRSFAVDVADPANPHLSMLYGDPAQMEFYGTTLLVNGVPKPVHRAEPRWHRLRVVNGSNSRFHHLWAARPHDPRHPWRFTKGSRGVRMVQIGSDGGLLSQAVEVGHARDGRPGVSGVLLAPGERADLLLDLSDVPDGERVVLWTNGPGEPWNPTDFPVDDRREGNTEGLMCFEVSGERTLTAPDLHAIEALHSPTITIRSREQKIALHGLRPEACLPGEETPVDLAELADGLRDWQVQRRRRTEVDDPAGASLPVAGAPLSRRVITLIEPVPGYPSFSLPLHGMAEPLGWDSVLSEQVRQNSVEMWEIVNRTGDTHPIHLHLVQFRVVARFPFDDESMTQSNSVVPAGDYLPPAPGERGWKDVVRCNPDEVTQVVAAFDLPGHYMYHCHILEHEDAGMMRPFIVRPATNG
jgi:spore coat protein A